MNFERFRWVCKPSPDGAIEVACKLVFPKRRLGHIMRLASGNISIL